MAQKLVKAGFWVDGEEGYRLLSCDEYQRTKKQAKVGKAKAAKARERKAAWRHGGRTGLERRSRPRPSTTAARDAGWGDTPAPTSSASAGRQVSASGSAVSTPPSSATITVGVTWKPTGRQPNGGRASSRRGNPAGALDTVMVAAHLADGCAVAKDAVAALVADGWRPPQPENLTKPRKRRWRLGRSHFPFQGIGSIREFSQQSFRRHPYLQAERRDGG